MSIDPIESANAGMQQMHMNETRMLDLEDAKNEATRKIEQMTQLGVIKALRGEKWKRLIEEGSFIKLLSHMQRYVSLINKFVVISDLHAGLSIQDNLTSLAGIVRRCYSNSPESENVTNDRVRAYYAMKKGSNGSSRRLADPDPNLKPQIISRRPQR